MVPKKHMCKSRETIPLIQILRRRNLRNQQNWSAGAVFGTYGITIPLISFEYYQVPYIFFVTPIVTEKIDIVSLTGIFLK
jgi:hypothetical protein